MNNRKSWLLLLVSFLLLAALPVAAQDEITADQVNEVAKGLFCPVCESTPLDVCPTQACADWRELISEQLASGMSEQEIHDYFAQQYGDAVLAETPRRGFGLFLWGFPIVAILIGGYFFSRQLTEMRSAGRAAAQQKEAALEGYRDQIEQELEQLSS